MLYPPVQPFTNVEMDHIAFYNATVRNRKLIRIFPMGGTARGAGGNYSRLPIGLPLARGTFSFFNKLTQKVLNGYHLIFFNIHH
jgi:hypothetical protein